MSGASCAKCKAPIMWIAHENTGRAMPLNVNPHPTIPGNVELVTRPDNKRVGRVHAGKNLEAARSAGTKLYLNHFADCPFAAGFRKKPAGA